MNRVLFVINVDWYFILHWIARAKSVRSEGYEVVVVTRITSNDNHQRLLEEGFKVVDLGLDRKSLGLIGNVKALLKIYETILKFEPKLVHSITVKPNVFAGLTCRYLGIPQVMNVTGLGITFSSNSFKSIISKNIILILYRISAKNNKLRIIFENNDDKNLFEQTKVASLNKLKVIKGAGINTDEYCYIEESNNKVPKILFAARMLWDKGIKQLIEASDILRTKGYIFELNVAGILDDQSSAAIPEDVLINWDCSNKINWLGRRADMPELISDSNIVCLPTTYGEGVPRILIEACAIGRAVVATNVSGCREIVRHNETGLLVEPNNVHELSVALERLLIDCELRKSFGVNARQLVLDQYSEGKVISETLSVYREVLS